MTNNLQMYNVYAQKLSTGLDVIYSLSDTTKLLWINTFLITAPPPLSLNSSRLSPNKRKFFFFALFEIAHALSGNLRHYSVNYLYSLLHQVLLQDFVTEHRILEGNQINNSWDKTIKGMFSPTYSSLLMASRPSTKDKARTFLWALTVFLITVYFSEEAVDTVILMGTVAPQVSAWACRSPKHAYYESWNGSGWKEP